MKDSLLESAVAASTFWLFNSLLSLISFLQPLELSDLIKLQIAVMINFLQFSDKLLK